MNRDNEKARLCKEKGIDLVVIYFLCKKENELFKDNINIYWYQEDLALEKNSAKLLDKRDKLAIYSKQDGICPCEQHFGFNEMEKDR